MATVKHQSQSAKKLESVNQDQSGRFRSCQDQSGPVRSFQVHFQSGSLSQVHFRVLVRYERSVGSTGKVHHREKYLDGARR